MKQSNKIIIFIFGAALLLIYLYPQKTKSELTKLLMKLN